MPPTPLRLGVVVLDMPITLVAIRSSPSRTRAVRQHIPWPCAARHASSSSAAATTARRIAQTTARTPAAPARAASRAGGQTFAATLAQRGTRTLLYEAPSHRWMTLSATTAGIFCLSYAGINYALNVHTAPPELSPWAMAAFTGICAAMAGMGTVFILRPSGIIQSITAVPRTATSATTAAAARSSPSSSSPGIMLELAIRRPLGLPLRKVTVAPEKVVLRRRLVPGPGPTEEQRYAQAVATRVEREQMARYDRDHLLTMPFRQASRGAAAAWRGVRRALVGGGFASVEVEGRKCKLDVDSAWALEDGRALERLVRTRLE